MKFLSLTIFFMSLAAFGDGEGSLFLPKVLTDSTIVDKAGVHIPGDIQLTDHNGRQVKLKDYFTDGDERPVILTLGYYECPMLCSLVLNGLVKGLTALSLKPGDDFRIISVSINEKESVDLAQSKRDAYLHSLGVKPDVDWWSFHVATAPEVKRLADAVGFHYYYDKKIEEYAHSAGIFVVTPKLILSHTIFGIEYKPNDLKFALMAASEGKIGSFVDQLILSCFHYDPDSHRYGVYIFGVMRICGMLTILILAVMLLMYFRGERKRVDSLS